MSFQQVKTFFEEQNLGRRVQEFDVSSATVELAAAAVGCEPARIAKTLSFSLDGGAVLIVAAGDAKINSSKYKAQFGAKATMLTPSQVEELVGHSVGGVCPFCTKPGVSVYLDISLQRFESVYPACGSSNSAVCLTQKELLDCSGSLGWVDVCKGWTD